MKITLYRYCMLIAAFALLALAIISFITFPGVVNELSKSNDMSPFHRNSIRGLWLTFASQNLLFALLYFLVASRPRAMSREVIVICGLLQLVAAILIFYFASSTTSMYLLSVAALLVLVGSMLWPSEEDVAAEKLRAAAAITSATSATTLPAATPATSLPPDDNSGL